MSGKGKVIAVGALFLLAAGITYFITPARTLRKYGISKPLKPQEFSFVAYNLGVAQLSDFIGCPLILYTWSQESAHSVATLQLMERLSGKYKGTRVKVLPVEFSSAFHRREQSFPGYVTDWGISWSRKEDLGFYQSAGNPWVYLVNRKGIVEKEFMPDIADEKRISLWADKMLRDDSPDACCSEDDSSYADTAELVPDRQMRDSVLDLLANRQFLELEGLAEGFRSEKAKSLRGVWKLHLFYLALSSGLSDRPSWERRLEMIEKWREAWPDSVTARVALGIFLAAFAFNERGTAYSSEVTEEQRSEFVKLLARARETLEAAEVMDVKCPGVYEGLLHVARGEGWDRREFETVFGKAVALEPGYLAFYYIKAFHLLPQWYGEPGEWERYAEEAAGHTKAMEGMGVYARIVMNMASALDKKDEMFKATRVSWPLMRQGFWDIIERYPDSLYELNLFAWYACLAGDKPTARAVFARLGDGYSASVWHTKTAFLRKRKWAREATLSERLAEIF